MRAREYILQNTSATQIDGPLLTDDKPSVAIRETPGNVEARYSVGKNFNISFQILVRDESLLTANALIYEIQNVLDGLGQGAILSQDGSFSFVKCEVSTPANWVEKDNYGHIYTAIFTAELEML